MYKNILNILAIIFLVTSCNSMDTAKKALTGEKRTSTDEFLVKKKDPLILPPDYENLPVPDESADTNEDSSIFEKNLEAMIEDDSSAPSSVEDSILKKIRSR
jgi:hypothetical protein|tara:strand:- start:1199 stop:1504 length:306 start_codon:yes stop_codon:yes gene_type:complete